MTTLRIPSSLDALVRWDHSRAFLIIGVILVLGHILALTNVLGFAFDCHFDWLANIHQNAPAELCRDSPERNALLTAITSALSTASGNVLRLPQALSAWSKAGGLLDTLFHTPCTGTMAVRGVIESVKTTPAVLALSWILSLGPPSVMLPVLFLALAMTRVAGSLAVFLVARRLSGSTAAALACYTLFAMMLPQPPLGIFMAFTLDLGLIALAPRHQGKSRSLTARLGADALFAVIFAANALVYIFLQNAVHAGVVPLVLALLFMIAIARMDGRLFARVLLIAVCVFVMSLPYHRYGQRSLAPLTTANFAKKEVGLPLALFHGTGERPNPYGYIATDTGGLMQHFRDVYLLNNAPALIAYHGYNRYARELLCDTLTTHPFGYLYTIWKRLATSINSAGTFPHSDVFSNAGANVLPAILWGTCLVLILSLACFPLLSDLLLASGTILWEALGMHVLFTWLHGSDEYAVLGEVLAVALFPCLLLRLATSRAMLFKRRGKVLILTGTGLACVLAVSLLPQARRGLQKEHQFMALTDILTYRSVTDVNYADPMRIKKLLDSIAVLGDEDPGELAMFAAWYYYHLIHWRLDVPWYVTYANEQNRPRLDSYSAQARELMLKAYAAALKASPDNAYYPAYAKMLGVPGWEDIFRAALKKHPDATLSAMMANELLKSGHVSVDEHIDLQKFLDRAMGKELESTAHARPGYRQRPALRSMEGILTTDSPEGTKLLMAPGRTVALESFKTYGSPEIVVGSYARLLSGEASISLLIDGATACAREVLSRHAGDESDYRRLACMVSEKSTNSAHLEIMSGPDGAAVVIRDVYPLVTRPRMPLSH